MKIIQITDTHLSSLKPQFEENWKPLVAWIDSLGPDLVVHTGDLTVDGADFEEDLVHSRELLRDLQYPTLCVPGNHDVGDVPGTRQPIDGERLSRWRRIIGPDRWAHDLGEWRLIGLNSLIIGSGSSEEDEQLAWLENTLRTREGRRVLVFKHKPLFIEDPDEGESGYWGLRPEPRLQLLALFAANGVELVASGHLHRARIVDRAPFRCVWGLSSGFVVGPMVHMPYGDALLGAAVHTLGATVESRIVPLDTLRPIVLDDVLHEVYPPAPVKGALS
ncbi:metallophosphoesterase family protein [Microvirga massiliensis]|uniref:metallophosphoesterase family protein n=1 Tax=Microvirga massiliensis TaxID=1033741 RepID=UPI00062BCD67|nr:metallophosphoesterase [Microvirga massiliensis]